MLQCPCCLIAPYNTLFILHFEVHLLYSSLVLQCLCCLIAPFNTLFILHFGVHLLYSNAAMSMLSITHFLSYTLGSTCSTVMLQCLCCIAAFTQAPGPKSGFEIWITIHIHGRGGLSLDSNPVCLRVNATSLDQDLDQNARVNGAYVCKLFQLKSYTLGTGLPHFL